MSSEDLFYMIFLFGAVPYGYVIRLCDNVQLKKFLILLSGFMVVYAICGVKDGLHSMITILGTYTIIRLAGARYGPWMAFIFNFSYLFFFRTLCWYGVQISYLYSNAVQLFVTLRMCTIAFEGFQIGSGEARPTTKLEYERAAKLKITLFDIFTYGYNFCGLLTGPHCRFITFVDMLHNKSTSDIPVLKTTLHRLKYLPLYGLVYLPLKAYFPIEHIGSQEWLNHPWGLWYKFGYLVPTAVWFRWRFHIGWTLAEASCIMMGLGAYPVQCKSKPGKGPTVEINIKDDTENKNIKEYDFETIHNIGVYEIETASNIRAFARNWNMTVQWWLVTYVHKKLPFKNRLLRMLIVMMVSAFWHGIKPGYYLCFLTVTAIAAAELRMEHVFQPSSGNDRFQKWYNWTNWFILFRILDYNGVSFMLLELYPVWLVWKELYFCMHILLVLFILVSFLLPVSNVSKTTVKYENGWKKE